MELKADKLCKVYGTTTVLSDVSFVLEKGQKVGLVGDNGTGKSTLFKILTGELAADSGAVTLRKGATIGYLPQDTGLVSEETVRDYNRRVSGVAALEQQLEHSPEALAEYDRRDGYSFDHRLEVMLSGFGLAGVADAPINSLSSGQRSKVFMVGVLSQDPDILLFDEPTNNLDLPALIWLEDFLVRSEQACVVISHDRLFLDKVVRKIFEIDRNTRTLTVTNGRYSDYLVRRQKAQKRQRVEHEAQQQEIRRLEDSARSKRAEAARGASFHGTDNDKFARGFKQNRAGRSGKAAKAIERRIEQMEIVEKPVSREMLRIRLEPSRPDGARDITLAKVVAGYESTGFRIGPVSIEIPYGGRVALLGLNGSGKTTLLRTISGQLPALTGEVAIGKGLVVGNFTQEHDTLPREESLREFLTRRTGRAVSEVYALAAQFGFKAEEIDKQIKFFSPGGRARLLFALFSALAVNCLLLDEPTNHLDLEALEALQEAVAHYEGTVVVVSHDRYFLQGFRASDTYLISERRVDRVENLHEYLANAQRAAQRLIRLL